MLSEVGKRLSVAATLVLAALVAHSTNHTPKVQRVFDEGTPWRRDQYEIKSCLSPDLQIHEQATCRFYALMIDAGSTGTRIHIFQFSHDTQNKAAPFKLEKETFAEVKPGLSSYTYAPSDAAKSIEPLINKAKSTVPRNLWSHTPISLKATAGVRLLNPVHAEIIMNEIERVLKATPFLTNEDSATIMTGTDEGIFGWFTLNFLLDRLDALSLKPKELSTAVHDKLTAAALDLGGGSTQITFRPRSPMTEQEAPEDFIKQIRLFGQNVQLYTHSYLGNGLVAARLGSLKKSNLDAKLSFFTSCLPANYSLKWNYTEAWLTVTGKEKYGYENCYGEFERFVESCLVDQPPELAFRDVYAFGYYFDRAYQSNLVGVDGGNVSVARFEEAARNACLKFAFGKQHWEPWMCMDLSYIVALLKRGYNLPVTKEFTLVKKIRTMEMSWGLGASYHLLNTYHERNAERRASMEKSSSNSNATQMGAGGGCGEYFVNVGVSYLCTRVFSSLTSLLSFFQLLA